MCGLNRSCNKPVLHVVGGTYREFCSSPHWDQLFGSGLRAAVACSGLQEDSLSVKLTTYAAKSEEKELRYLAETFGVTLECFHRHNEIQFRYEHPLAPPSVIGKHRVEPVQHNLTLKADVALVFSLIEAFVPVQAKRLIYDPQAGKHAVPFGQLSCEAEEFCIVANLTEAMALLGKPNPARLSALRAAEGLYDKTQASAVVVKDGILGAAVASPAGVSIVPSRQTEDVFPIGSGDVFSAAFAYSWGCAKHSPQDAAEFACNAVAYYVSTQCLPVPPDVDQWVKHYSPMPVAAPQVPGAIYIAGPLFNVPERWFVQESARCLQDLGLTVFSPMEHVGFPSSVSTIAEEDLRGLKNAKALLALIDGCDAGTLFEVGYAAATGIPVVAYGERVSESDLTMLRGTGAQFFRDFASAIYNVAWLAMRP